MSEGAGRPRQLAALPLLAVAAGALDAISYLAFGRVFVANMTGNTVLLAIALATHAGGAALRSAVSLGGFCLGVAAGALVLGDERRGDWLRRSIAVLSLECAVLAALLAAWLAWGAHGGTRFALVAIAAGAMGLQSAAVRVARAGVNTTYITSTIATGVASAIGRLRPHRDEEASPRDVALPAAIWLVYAGGAVAGAFAQSGWHAWAVAIPLVLVGAVRAGARDR